MVGAPRLDGVQREAGELRVLAGDETMHERVIDIDLVNMHPRNDHGRHASVPQCQPSTELSRPREQLVRAACAEHEIGRNNVPVPHGCASRTDPSLNMLGLPGGGPGAGAVVPEPPVSAQQVGAAVGSRMPV